MIETVQISKEAAVTLETPKKTKVLFLDGYIVNSIIAFIVSLLFIRAGTAFALDTFACDMTNSMSLTFIKLFLFALIQLEPVCFLDCLRQLHLEL